MKVRINTESVLMECAERVGGVRGPQLDLLIPTRRQKEVLFLPSICEPLSSKAIRVRFEVRVRVEIRVKVRVSIGL